MPTKVYCYHVNDENKLMHICNDLMKGKRAMARVCWVGGSTEDWYWWLGKSNRYGRYIYANLVTTSKLTRELCPGIRARWFLWNVSANSHMTSVTKRNMLDPTGKVGDCSYTPHNHHPLGCIFLEGRNMSFFSDSIACIKFWIFISYQTEHIVAIIVLPPYFQHPAPASHMWLKRSFLDKGKMAKISPKITKIEI